MEFHFVPGREGYFEEEEGKQMLGDLGKGEFHLSPPSSSSATSPSSSSQYKGMVTQQLNGGDPERCTWVGEKERMFDKVVTPSDVGKLNRLVIPKQYAEKYFPVDWTVNEKGLLLNFEDSSGKPWRFRYSYWNSSQSYVMTKGWSRFVKEKKLDAGDIVSFQRGVGELGKDRFYIDWKHRPNTRLDPLHRTVPLGRYFMPLSLPHLHLQQLNCSADHVNYGVNGYNVMNPGGSLFYQQSAGAVQMGSGADRSWASPMVIDGVQAVHKKAATKRVRLFGVNLDCPTSTTSGNNGDDSLFTPSVRTPQAIAMMPSYPLLQPPLKTRLFNGIPLPVEPSQLSRKGKQPLSLDLDL
ncbi:hypothetical protein AAC387_Pa08g0666 [Persea americana]